ncbi:MAG: M20 family metallopeptidase [Anaerolineales bacterium]|jgi:glutamate carboxypeptidase
MNVEGLHTKIKSYLPSMLSTLEDLVGRESPSTEKASTDAYAGNLAERFDQLGAETSLISNETGGAQLKVLFRVPKARQVKPGLLLCHYDTVWPLGTITEMPFKIEGDKAFGPGVYDMKASHVMVEYALRAIADLELQLPRPMEILFTSDEEIGSLNSRQLIEERARQAEYVLVLEPPTAEGALKTSRKGVGGFRLRVFGKAAHAGSQPELGISAINELARQILVIQELADPEKGTTINAGVIRGGTRSNVIAAQAEAQIDVRVWTPQEAQRIEGAVKILQPITPGAKIRIEGGFERPPLVRTEAVTGLFQQVKGIGAELGLDLQEGSTGGGSDGNFTAALGVPTLDGMGAMGDGAHADNEHIQISQLPDRISILAAALLKL